MDDEEYMKIIRIDIRNSQGLNAQQMQYVLGLDNEKKNEIIKLFNEVLRCCHDYIVEFTR